VDGKARICSSEGHEHITHAVSKRDAARVGARLKISQPERRFLQSDISDSERNFKLQSAIAVGNGIAVRESSRIPLYTSTTPMSRASPKASPGDYELLDRLRYIPSSTPNGSFRECGPNSLETKNTSFSKQVLYRQPSRN